MSAHDQGLMAATEVARGLVGCPVEVSRIATGGRNSRIWRVRGGGRAFALKQYPPRQDDPRDRLSTEVGALRLMERYRIDTVPRVVGVDGERGYALLSWIDGAAVIEVGDADIDAAVAIPCGHPRACAPRRGRRNSRRPPRPACAASEIERQIGRDCARLGT